METNFITFVKLVLILTVPLVISDCGRVQSHSRRVSRRRKMLPERKRFFLTGTDPFNNSSDPSGQICEKIC